MDVNTKIKWKMVSNNKGRDTPKPCPICGKSYNTKLVRHIEKMHPSVCKKHGRDVIEKCSRGVTCLVSKGISRYMDMNNKIKWKMVATNKGIGTPKPCPICGKRYSTQLVRHIAKVHPSVYKKYGREVVEKCSRAITSLVAKGVFRYPEHFILSAFGAAWRESPEEVRESLACLGVEVIPSGISLPEACGLEEEMDVDGNADIGRSGSFASVMLNGNLSSPRGGSSKYSG